jgi:hypothetical protein
VTGLQCAWVRRALLHDHDNWSSKLTKLNKDFELTLTERDITNFGPVLGGILRNFLKFRDSLIEYKNNYVHVPILNNKKFIVKRGEAGIFDDNFFETFAPGIDVNTRSTLTWHKCTDGNKEFLGREALNDNIGTRLDFRSYVRLKSGYANAKRKFDDGKVGAKRKLKDFIIMNKNGAKGFRVVFKETKTNTVTKQLKNFSKLIELENPDPISAVKINSAWNKNNYGSETKDFIFKFYNNVLGVGARVAHYNENTDPRCTFCVKKMISPADRETFIHLFWNCTVTSSLIDKFAGTYFRSTTTKECYFYGYINGITCPIRLMIWNIFRHTLWLFRQKKRLPIWTAFENEFNYNFGAILNSNKKVKTKLQNMLLFRDVRDE